MGKGYWGFLLGELKSPTTVALQVNKAQYINGLITFALYALITSLTTFIQVKLVSGAIFGDLLDGMGLNRGNFFTTFLLPFLSTAIMLLLMSCIIFGITILMKNQQSLQDVIARFGAFMSIPLALSALSLIFSILGGVIPWFALIFTSLSYVSYSTATIFTVYSYRNRAGQGLDPFYGVLLTFAAMGILTAIFGSSLLKGFSGMVF